MTRTAPIDPMLRGDLHRGDLGTIDDLIAEVDRIAAAHGDRPRWVALNTTQIERLLVIAASALDAARERAELRRSSW